MLDPLVRALGSVNARLGPAILHRLDRPLAKHAPLLWRSRVHWVVWWSLLSACAFGTVGLLAASQLATVAPETLVVAANLASVGALLAWSITQLPLPLGASHWFRHARGWLLDAAASFLLVLPAQLLIPATTFPQLRQATISSAVWSLGWATLLGFANRPRSIRRGERTSRTRIRWPRWLARLDHRLLITHPRLWASRLHLFSLLVTVPSLGLMALLLADPSRLERWGPVYFLLNAIAPPLIWSMIWRAEARASQPTRWGTQVRLVLLALLPSSSASWLVLASGGGPTGDSPMDRAILVMLLQVVLGLSIVSAVLVRVYTPRLFAVEIVAGTAAFWFALSAALDRLLDRGAIFWFTFIAIPAWFLAVWSVGRAPASPISHARLVVASVLVASCPLILASMLVLFLLGMRMAGSAFTPWVVLGFAVILTELLYVRGLRRVGAVLICAHNEPRAE